MKRKYSDTYFVYVIIAILVFITTVIITMQFVTGVNKWLLAITLLGSFSVVFILLHLIYTYHIKPVEGIRSVLQELIKGNYTARVYEKTYYENERLGYAVNQLAFNLQNLNRQDKMHSRQLRTVIDSMGSGVMLLDAKGYIQLVNKHLTKTFNQTENTMHNKLYYDVTNEEKIHQTIQQVYLYEETIKNMMMITQGDKTLHLEIIAVPFFNETQDLRGLVLVFHDITELKRVEKMRKDFVANVSHELKTPITSIKGFAETLMEDDIDDSILEKKFLSIIYKESDRLQALIHDLLELSKLERDEFEIELKKVNLSYLIHNMIATVTDKASKKGIKMKVDVPEELYLIGDGQRLKQVILNLLYNAINYSEDEGEVVVKAKSLKQDIELSISDNGIGIPSEVVDRIFERFYRVNQDRGRDTGGTGLGLAIVKHIVESHNGSIKVDSELNIGTTFTITLPKHI